MQAGRFGRKMHSKEMFSKRKVLLSRKIPISHQYQRPYSSCIALGLNILSTKELTPLRLSGPFLCWALQHHQQTWIQAWIKHEWNAGRGMDSRGKRGQAVSSSGGPGGIRDPWPVPHLLHPQNTSSSIFLH